MLVELGEDVLDRTGVVAQAAGDAHPLEDLLVLGPGGIDHRDLVMNAPEKGLLDQLRRIEVRGEYQKAVERHRELAAGMESQVIDPLFQRARSTG